MNDRCSTWSFFKNNNNQSLSSGALDGERRGDVLLRAARRHSAEQWRRAQGARRAGQTAFRLIISHSLTPFAEETTLCRSLATFHFRVKLD